MRQRSFVRIPALLLVAVVALLVASGRPSGQLGGGTYGRASQPIQLRTPTIGVPDPNHP